MNKKEIFKKLNELCEEMDNSYYINDGGCCFVAACLAENFEKYNIPFSVIYFNKKGVHYCIKISDRYINRSGYSRNEIGEIASWSSKHLHKIYRYGSWNSCYNKKWNLIVSTRIKSIFNKYANC